MELFLADTIFTLAPPRLLFSVYSNRVQRVNTDGQNYINLYTVSYPRAMDFDFE